MAGECRRGPDQSSGLFTQQTSQLLQTALFEGSGSQTGRYLFQAQDAAAAAADEPL